MALFQSSVLKKNLENQDKFKIEKAFKKFKEYFHNPEIQKNIIASKEEQFQATFLTELFVEILGYTMNPRPDYELTTEFKNLIGSKKADGAILENKKAIAVIELKSTKVKDLEKIRQQAFDYKSHHPTCVYVISSTFDRLRFYINNSVDFEEFNLFNLTQDRFELLYFCLAKDNLLDNLPLKTKEASLIEEKKITNKLYSDYSLFKREIYRDIVKKNIQNPALIELTDKNIKKTLFQKTQKLLDRFLFIFFAEDRGLLPPNSISKIVEKWNDDNDWGDNRSLYSIYQKYFDVLNVGRPKRGKRPEIFAYNGGLFIPDPILDSIIIDDDLLLKHTSILTKYDFETDVDVNILGHIFENSLNEIETVNAEIEGIAFDNQKAKRKKDGVFYTPKYITKYIVDNAVGKLCKEKKQELEINEEIYLYAKQRSKKRIDNLETYRNWLLQLTICDPACGSGAFLNQALDYLIKEHEYVDILTAKYHNAPLILSDIENSILENNIFGVDINQESVEIAKLSLWLRTAQKGRKLTSLSDNIKCGNSLIDDPEVTGEKAFNWQKEFPEVFAKGGFDVMIGNPPYVRKQGLIEHYPEMTIFYEKTFVSATGNYDIYALFMEQSYKLINNKGKVSFILPHKFLVSDFGTGIRLFFIENTAVSEIIHFGSEMVFDDASTYTCIINLSKEHKKDIEFKHLKPSQLFDSNTFSKVSYLILNSEQWILTDKLIGDILAKIQLQPLKLKDIFARFVQGIITGRDAVFCVKGKINGNYLKITDEYGNIHKIEKDILKPHLRGEDVNKFCHLENKEWLIFPYQLIDGKAELIEPKIIETKYSNTLKYLKVYENILREREKGKFNNKYWYQYSRNQAISVLEQPKIITREICYGGSMTYDENNFYHNSKCHTLLLKEKSNYSYKSILPIINSSLFWFYLSNTGNVLRGGYIGVKRKVLEPFSIPNFEDIDNNQFEVFTDSMLREKAKLQSISVMFTKYVQSQFNIEKLSKKLEHWYKLEFGEFIIELNKAIKKAGGEKLRKIDEIEWMEVFETKKVEAQKLKAEIDKTDKEIDAMVYKLYGLTEEEIKIVENS